LDDGIETLQLVKYLEKLGGVKKIVYMSTGEVYGNCFRPTEDSSLVVEGVTDNRSSYSIAKILGEYAVQHSKIPSLIIRPFAVYGPRQLGPGVLTKFICNIIKGRNIEVYNSGTDIRSLCFISDFTDAMDWLIRKDMTGIFNVGNQYSSISMMELAHRVVNLLNSNTRIVKSQMEAYKKKTISVPNTDKLEKTIKWSPEVGLDDGILRTYLWYNEWIRNNKDWEA
jgi:nucleoside-diphosphate-sugar epimerase